MLPACAAVARTGAPANQTSMLDAPWSPSVAPCGEAGNPARDIPDWAAYDRRMSTINGCADCVVRDQTLCSSLTDVELTALNTHGRKQTLARDGTLIWAGDDSLICANVISGVLKLVASTADGREQIVGLLFAADFVGRPYADHSEFTVTAVTDVELCVFPRGPFERVLEDHVRMERMLLQRTLAALDQARAQMLVLARSSAAEKVAGFLASMAVRARGAGCRATLDGALTFDLPLSRGQIADVLGLTIETVSRQITRLRVDRIIDLPGGRTITLLDGDALANRAELA